MPSGLIGIGSGALAAASLALRTTAHNISNANTPGFSRQQTLQATNAPRFTGAGFLGQGVNVASVVRQHSAFLETQLQTTQSRQAEFSAWHTQLRQIDDLLADPTAGLTPALDEFFAGIEALAERPGDTAARQSALASGSALSARFQALDTRFTQLRAETNGRVAASVDVINGYTTQIADLNERIQLATANGLQAPNDLLDERDRLVGGLNGQIRAATVMQSDGTVNVFFGNGQPAVVGHSAYALVARPDPGNPQVTQVGLQAGPSLVVFAAADVGGGELAGLLAFRDQSLAAATNGLGRAAMTLAAAFNAQHEAGMDLTGALGGAFFSVGAPQVLADLGNTGAATLSASVTTYASLTTSDYRVAYDGSQFTITRLADGQAQNFATLPQTVDGVAFTLAGAPAAGDSYLVQPTINGARDFRGLITDTSRIAAAGPVRAASDRANLGNGVISAPRVTPPPDANLTQTVTITFTSAGTFDVAGTGTGNPAGIAYTAGGTISFNGWSLAITGEPRAGDTFTVSLNAAASGDNRNALALLGLQTARITEGGNASINESYAGLVSGVANETRTLGVGAQAQSLLATQASNARDGLSGVNLDEEAASLLRYQQAYQAAGRVIQIADELFATILGIGN